jgi:hypothetical protein
MDINAPRSRGRPPKSGERRIKKSVMLTPRVWAFIALVQLGKPKMSESDALEAICRSHLLFCPDEKGTEQ